MTHSEELAEFKESLGELVEEAPELEQFVGFVASAEATTVIDHKTKELMSLAIDVVTRCDHCIFWHTDAALEAGASHEEIVETLKIAVVMGAARQRPMQPSHTRHFRCLRPSARSNKTCC